MKIKVAVFDMDGTLCDVVDIRHYVMGKKRNFDAFHRASIDCPPNEDVVDILRSYEASGIKIIIVTARKRRYEQVTTAWLDKHDIPYDDMYMRDNHDNRPDYEVKAEILEQIEAAGQHVVHAVDDNPNVIRLWEENGIPVTVVPGWDTTPAAA